MRKKWLVWLGYLLLIPSILFNLWQKSNNEPQRETYLVTDIYDGDSFKVDNQMILRMFNIDAPEKELCGGKEAKQLLTDLIFNKRVSIHAYSHDVYRRLLVDVFLDGKSIEEKLIVSGWVEYVHGGENFKQVSKTAKEKKLGLYSPVCTQWENPQDKNCSIKGNVGKDDQSRYYHFPGCQRYDLISVDLYLGDQWFCTEAEARAAKFTKSSQCFEKKLEKKI